MGRAAALQARRLHTLLTLPNKTLRRACPGTETLHLWEWQRATADDQEGGHGAFAEWAEARATAAQAASQGPAAAAFEEVCCLPAGCLPARMCAGPNALVVVRVDEQTRDLLDCWLRLPVLMLGR